MNEIEVQIKRMVNQIRSTGKIIKKDDDFDALLLGFRHNLSVMEALRAMDLEERVKTVNDEKKLSKLIRGLWPTSV